MTAFKGYQSPEAIAEGLDLPIRQVKDALEFIIKTGLRRMEEGKLAIGPSSTHLESQSPWVISHDINWRLRSVELMRWRQDDSLRYTAPMTLSAKDARKVREMIVQFLEKIDAVIEDSPSEELHCLTIDWFRVDGRD